MAEKVEKVLMPGTDVLPSTAGLSITERRGRGWMEDPQWQGPIYYPMGMETLTVRQKSCISSRKSNSSKINCLGIRKSVYLDHENCLGS